MIIQLPVDVFVRAVGAVSLAASDDETRPQFNAVQFCREGGRTRINATDGHWLARWDVASYDGSGHGEVETLVPKFTVLEALRVAKKLRQGTVIVDTTERSITFVPSNTVFRYPEINQTFPNLDQVMPAPGSHGNANAIGVSAHLLANVCKAFGVADTGKKNTATFVLELTGSGLDPIVASSDEVPLVVVLMPARTNRNACRVMAEVDHAAAE